MILVNLGALNSKFDVTGAILRLSASFWCMQPRFGANRGKSSVSLDRQSRW